MLRSVDLHRSLFLEFLYWTLVLVLLSSLHIKLAPEHFEVSGESAAMVAKENGEGRLAKDFEKERKIVNDGESYYEQSKDILSSQNSEDCGMEKKNLRVPTKNAKKESGGSYLRPTKNVINGQEQKNLVKKSHKPNKVVSSVIKADNQNPVSRIGLLRSPELCEDIGCKTIEEVKEIDLLDEAPICDKNIGTDDSITGAEENNLDDDVKTSVHKKVEEMEFRIEMLEEELTVVASLEISLYSYVPEHGSSMHKVHTPARRLARLYIHACKHSSLGKRATVAKNTVSGLTNIAKSCGNDIPRLTFWLSNTIILREIISQAFVSVSRSRVGTRPVDIEICRQLQLIKLENKSEGKQEKVIRSIQQINDWKETNTYIAALEKLESWIFSRIVESVWWQAFTPHMHSVAEDIYYPKSNWKFLGPSLGDPNQGNFSVKLWESAFHDAFSRLCPVRSGGHDCGCLPVLARLVMEQCVGRLDVAMFNAILRESAHEMPTDPISDPIVAPKVLPIPAGNLSFGSGAQLKNAIGSWTRWMEVFLGMNVENSGKDNAAGDDDNKRVDVGIKCFSLLNELSDLLMLPKDMLFEKTIRNEVCPSIGLPLIKRVLCNFTPDEFCPDPVPSIVLEMLNDESLIDGRAHHHANIFPHSASSVVYSPTLLHDYIQKLSDTDNKSPNSPTKMTMILRKGYTSDEDLDDLDDPFASIGRTSSSPAIAGDGILQKHISASNFRFDLLRKVWCECD